MVDSGTVRNDSSIIETLFNQYEETLNSVNDDSIWQGASKDNAISKSQEFIGEYKGTISNQMSSLANAVDLFKEYKAAKEAYNAASEAYAAAIANDDNAGASAAAQEMAMWKAKMDQLKPRIESLLVEIIAATKNQSIASGFNNKTGTASTTQGQILNVAKEIHKYMEDNNYKYCVYGSNGSEECSGSESHGLNSTFEASKNGYHHTCCATYVSWVLQEAGLLSNSEHSDGANNLKNTLVNKGWKEVSYSEKQPGDICWRNEHIQIVGDDNSIYNAGSGNSIRNEVSKSSGSLKQTDKYYRAP